VRKQGASQTRSTPATVSRIEREGDGLRVHYLAERGTQREISELLRLSPRGSLPAVHGVGRLLRILRAARLRLPADPYALADDVGRALELLERCRGAKIRLSLRRRMERQLTLWTESGIERIARVVDFEEGVDGLAVRTVGSQTPRWVPRQGLIRYATRAEESMEVTGVELL
jgi:hypothetical protein